jgi:dTDP-glucose pyrophosphorylase
MHNLLLSSNSTAREALRKLNEFGITAPVLFIFDENQQIIGSLTDGDIRRGLLKELNIDDNVKQFMFQTFRFLIDKNYTKSDFQKFKELKIRFIPVLNESKQLAKIIDLQEVQSQLSLSAVIMAGGKGERLLPLTENTPKPMLKVGKKPIIEHNIDRLIKFGINDITISIRFLGEQIMDYFGDGSSKNITIRYITEDKPLGTIGAVRQIEGFENEHILLMNSDLLTNIDFEDFYDVFIQENADMAVATVSYDVNVPYAVMDFSSGKQVKGFKEKPRYTYFSNAGIYLLKNSIINRIPKNKKYDATDLMNDLIESNLKLIAEPIHGYWLDIGRMEDYLKAQEDIKFLKF